jgi:hypothetical protein
MSKRYYGFQEWVDAGIPISLIDKESQHATLKRMGLPGLDFISLPTKDLHTNSLAKRFFEENDTIVAVMQPLREGLKKHGLVGPHSFDEVLEFARQAQPQEHYKILLTERVHDGISGTAVSDGKGSVYLEILNRKGVDQREISAGVADPLLIEHYWLDFGKERILPHSFNLELSRGISKMVQKHFGYFEYIIGPKNGKDGVWFMEVQPDSAMMNIFEQPNRQILEARAKN